MTSYSGILALRGFGPLMRDGHAGTWARGAAAQASDRRRSTGFGQPAFGAAAWPPSPSRGCSVDLERRTGLERQRAGGAAAQLEVWLKNKNIKY